MRAEIYLLGLPPKSLRRLLKAHVFSLADLLSCPTLTQVLRLPEDEVTRLLTLARSLQSSPPALVRYMDDRVATGLRELDMLLDGGLLPGGLYEIVGMPGMEATKTAIRMACSLMGKERNVLFCDIEGNFSRDMIPASYGTHFFYTRISTHAQLFRLLSDFTSFLRTPPFLVILDGVSSLLRCFPFTDHSYDRVHKVMETAIRLQEIGNRLGTVVVTTNRYTVTGSGEMLPLLGDSWSQVMVGRIEVERGPEGVLVKVRKNLGWEMPGEVIAYSI